MNQKFGKENITFSLSSIPRAIEWINNNLNQLYQSVDIIDTRLYKVLRKNKNSFNDTNIYT